MEGFAVTPYHRVVHVCSCPACEVHPHSRIAREHRTINRLLMLADERLRRLLAGFFALQRGHGGIVEVERITGIDRNTISKGLYEVRDGRAWSLGRIRQAGAGRKRMEVKNPGC
jgi:hypothetical protein